MFMLVASRGDSGANLSELSAAFGLSDAALIIHAGQLERAGLITTRRIDGQTCWRVNQDGVAALIGCLSNACPVNDPSRDRA
jgi:DNA-binding transcriptional ArsR family regulator